MDVFELARSVDIAEIVQNYVHLKPKGGHYLGLCPFHSDTKLGSFKVTPSKGLFKCWSCGAVGDGIQFVSMICEVSKREAAIQIAENFNLVSAGEAMELRGGRKELSSERRYLPVKKIQPTLLAPIRKPNELHLVYQAFINAADGINETFRQRLYEERHLEKSDLGDYFEFPKSSDSKFWARFRKELRMLTGIVSEKEQDEYLLGVPGFFQNKWGRTVFLSPQKATLGIATRDRTGHFSGLQMRVMEGIEVGESKYRYFSSGFADGRNSNGSLLGCNSGYIEDVLYPRGKRWHRAIAITEGRFKAVTLAKLGFIVVNMHSISNWEPASRVALALADTYKEVRLFVLVYDQEINNATLHSKQYLAKELMGKHPVDEAVWDMQYGKGVDDVVNAGHIDKISRIRYHGLKEPA